MPPSDTSAHLRAFVALPLDPTLAHQLSATQQQLRDRLDSADVRWTPLEQIHLTLSFFGNVRLQEVDAILRSLRRAAHDCAPFKLRLGAVGCFPSYHKPSVIWVGLGGEVESLLELQRRVDRETQAYGSHKPEIRSFHPHLTLGRVRAGSEEGRRLGEVLRSASALAGEWQVDSVVLMQSKLNPRGSVYSELGKIELSAGAH